MYVARRETYIPRRETYVARRGIYIRKGIDNIFYSLSYKFYNRQASYFYDLGFSLSQTADCSSLVVGKKRSPTTSRGIEVMGGAPGMELWKGLSFRRRR